MKPFLFVLYRHAQNSQDALEPITGYETTPRSSANNVMRSSRLARGVIIVAIAAVCFATRVQNTRPKFPAYTLTSRFVFANNATMQSKMKMWLIPAALI